LKAVDTNFGQSATSDPYVTVEKFERNAKGNFEKSNAPKWASSVVVKNNKEPVWAEKTTFHCDSSLRDVSLLISVYDHNDLLVR
jgi:Ca2+-dependent lipid-binding protein